MIRLTDPADRARLAAFCGDSLLGCYVMSRFLCYGNDYDFAKCYVAEDNGQIQSTLSVLDGAGVLAACDQTDWEELSLCLPLLGVHTLMTAAADADRLPFQPVRQKTAYRLTAAVPDATADDDAPLRDVYALISAAIPGSFPSSKEAYLHFLSDFTFRKTRGRARLKALFQNETLCACALTAAESDCAAVLSGVACSENCRGQGFGKTVVCALAHALQHENKTVHVIALNDAAGGFYRALGFEPITTLRWSSVS